MATAFLRQPSVLTSSQTLPTLSQSDCHSRRLCLGRRHPLPTIAASLLCGQSHSNFLSAGLTDLCDHRLTDETAFRPITTALPSSLPPSSPAFCVNHPASPVRQVVSHSLGCFRVVAQAIDSRGSRKTWDIEASCPRRKRALHQLLSAEADRVS